MAGNYFSLIPEINDHLKWREEEKNKITLDAPGGEIELDCYGAMLWKKIDGKRRVLDIADELGKELEEDKDLSLQRAIVFMQILRRRKLIRFADI